MQEDGVEMGESDEGVVVVNGVHEDGVSVHACAQILYVYKTTSSCTVAAHVFYQPEIQD